MARTEEQLIPTSEGVPNRLIGTQLIGGMVPPPPPSYTVATFEAEGITVATFEAGGNPDVADFEANGYVP